MYFCKAPVSRTVFPAKIPRIYGILCFNDRAREKAFNPRKQKYTRGATITLTQANLHADDLAIFKFLATRERENLSRKKNANMKYDNLTYV